MCGNNTKSPAPSPPQSDLKSPDYLFYISLDSMRSEVAFLKTQLKNLKKSLNAVVIQDELELHVDNMNVDDISKLHMLVDQRTVTPCVNSITMKDANGNATPSHANKMLSKMMTDSIAKMKALALANGRSTHPMVDNGDMKNIVKIARQLIDLDSGEQNTDSSMMIENMILSSSGKDVCCALAVDGSPKARSCGC